MGKNVWENCGDKNWKHDYKNKLRSKFFYLFREIKTEVYASFVS